MLTPVRTRAALVLTDVQPEVKKTDGPTGPVDWTRIWSDRTYLVRNRRLLLCVSTFINLRGFPDPVLGSELTNPTSVFPQRIKARCCDSHL